MIRRTLLAVCALALAGCVAPESGAGVRSETSEPTTTTRPPTTTTSTTTTTTLGVPEPPNLRGGDVCGLYGEEILEIGEISDEAIVEASGIAASRRTPGAFWVVNDSGNASEIYAIGTDGSTIATIDIEGVLGFDWEALAVGPGPEPDTSYVYIGDIGDNLRLRSTISLIRFPEPDLAEPPSAITDIKTIRLTFPEGARDSEAMFVDPVTGDAIVITKRQRNGKAVVFRAEAAAMENPEPVALQWVAEFRFDEGIFVTAADVTADGAVVALRGYDEVWMWVRTDLDFSETFAAEPCMGPSPDEIQGEALTFLHEGLGYVTLSEGSNKPLNAVEETSAR